MADREIRIVRGFSGYKQDSLSFKTGAAPEIVYDFQFHAFEDEGSEFGSLVPTALQLFYERLVLGDSFPSEMILNGVDCLQTVFAAALFISPDLVFTSECSSLVYAFSMGERWNDVALAHLSPTHIEVMRSVTQAVRTSKESPTIEEDYQRLMRGVTVLESYLRSGSLPSNPPDSRSYEVLKEEGAFIAFRASEPPWDLIYREGYMYGIWYPVMEESDVERPLIFKKSSLISYLDLRAVGRLLNVEEFGIEGKEGDGWLRSLDPTLLVCPERNPLDGTQMKGTSLSMNEISGLVLSVLKE